MHHVKDKRARKPTWQTACAYVWPLVIGALLASSFYVRPIRLAQLNRLNLSAQAIEADAAAGDKLAAGALVGTAAGASLRQKVALSAWPLNVSEDGSSHPDNPWLAEAEPECPYHGPELGLFEPSTPHPRFIVTGGAGFLGSHLVRSLAAEYGPGQVKVIDNFRTGFIARFQRDDGSWVINPQRDICALDLRVLRHAVQYLRGADYMYHLAEAGSTVGPGTARKSKVFQENLWISSNTLQACRINAISNFIYVSSACSPAQQAQEYLQSNLDALLEGQSFNGAAGDTSSRGVWSELAGGFEAGLDSSTDLNVGFVRLQNVYGPSNAWPIASLKNLGLEPSQLVASLLRKALNQTGGPFVVGGVPGNVLGDFVYVDDAVRALMLVKDRGMNKGVIEIGSGQAVTNQQLAGTIADVVAAATGKAVHVRYNTKVPLPVGGVSCTCDSVADVDRARLLLGWEPQYSLQQGVAATLEGMPRERQRSRVLVVLFGQPRGGDLAWKSIHRHLMLPNNAHLATVLTPINSTEANSGRTMLEAMAHWAWRVPEPADGDWSGWMDKAAGLCGASNTSGPTWTDLCQGPSGRRSSLWGGGFKCPKHGTMSAVVLVYAWVASQRILAWNLHRQYDYIIYSRPDQLHLCDHLLMADTPPKGVGVPRYKDSGGYYDRHMVGASSALLSAINHTQEFACNAGQYANLTRKGVIFNHESLMAHVWKRIKLPVWRFPMTMFAVRGHSDPTSWSKGQDNPALAPFGLKNKHAAEFNASVAACKVTNVTHNLELIQQHQVPLFD